MAHYLEIHTAPKAITQYAKVLDFCADGLNAQLTKVFGITRCPFNDIFRQFFDVPSTEWDAHYHVLDDNSIVYLIKDLEHERAVADWGDKEMMTSTIEMLKNILDVINTAEVSYLISWSK